jgi:hypothetical protein
MREVTQACHAAGEPGASADQFDGGVGTQRLLQGGGVGVLEPGDVAGEQFPGVRLGWLDDAVRGRSDLVEPGAGSLQRAPDQRIAGVAGLAQEAAHEPAHEVSAEEGILVLVGHKRFAACFHVHRWRKQHRRSWRRQALTPGPQLHGDRQPAPDRVPGERDVAGSGPLIQQPPVSGLHVGHRYRVHTALGQQPVVHEQRPGADRLGRTSCGACRPSR